MLRFLLPLLVAAFPAFGQMAPWQPVTLKPVTASSYSGPGDVVASATAWYGLRGYSAAYAATGTGNAVNVRRASDNATQDIVILTTGNLDVASYNTFVGTDATASCTIAGTAMACTGASATIHVNDPVTGVGITNPCVVTVTNGSTTATVSLAGRTTSCGTVAVAETVTFQVAGLLPTVYDQSGNTRPVAQPTAGTQTQLLPNCFNSLPCIYSSGGHYLIGSAVASNIAQPVTYSVVSVRTAVLGNDYALSAFDGGNGAALGYSSATLALMYAGSSVTATASNGVVHSLQGIFNGASSTISVDGVATTGQNVGTDAGNNKLGLFAHATGANGYLTGYIFEAGEWPSGFSAGNLTSVCHNQFVFWAFGTSC